MSQGFVAIVILNWNKKDDTAECLCSIYNMRYKKFDVILVDNGSNDGSVHFLKRKYPKVKYIENEENLGYAKGNNIGIRYALKGGYSFILLLNNDTIVDADLLTELLAVMDLDNKIGIAGGVNYYCSEKNKIQFSGGHIDWYRGNIYDITRHWEDRGQFSKYRKVDTISGSCMLIRREVFGQVGFFDERFFLNFEETDFCCRTQRVGYKVFTSMQASLWHKVSLSFSNYNNLLDYFITRNKFLFLWKNSARKYLIFSFPYHIIDTFLKVLKYMQIGRHQNIVAMLVGIRDCLLGRYYAGSMERLLNQ
jgi:GT2 family glycosyltransferase